MEVLIHYLVSLEENKWVHVAAVYDNGNLVIYVNGQRELNNTGGGSFNSSGDKLTIGKNSFNRFRVF